MADKNRGDRTAPSRPPRSMWTRKNVNEVVGGVGEALGKLTDLGEQVGGGMGEVSGKLTDLGEQVGGGIGEVSGKLTDLGEQLSPLDRAARAVEETARGVRADVGIALNEQRWDGGGPGGVVPGVGTGRAEAVVRSLTRWQGNDSSSLVRALRASFDRTESDGRSVIRYRGAGRLSSANGDGSQVGAEARTLRRITPGLSNIKDLLLQLEPIHAAADQFAVRSIAVAIMDRLDSYAEELARGFDARQARLQALRVTLRGGEPDVAVGGLLKKLNDALVLAAPPASEAEEQLVDDFLTLQEFVYQLDGKTPPHVAVVLGPTQWREEVEEALCALSDGLRELQTRLRIFGITPCQLEALNYGITGQSQSVADVLAWTDDLIQQSGPRLLAEARRSEAQLAIETEANELLPWVEGLLDLFGEQLLKDGVIRVRDDLVELGITLGRL
jgi:hypothetical protein